MIKGTLHQEKMAILNMYAPNNRVAKYVKQEQKKLKREINSQLYLENLIHFSQ